MSNFQKFSKLVTHQFDKMSKNVELYTVNIEQDSLWELYLSSFPEGTNPLYKERTEHDCNCCKQFIRNIANVVSLSNGKVTTVWDTAAADAPHPYNLISAILAEVVKNAGISTIFRKTEKTYGNEFTNQLLADRTTFRWYHFNATLKPKFTSQNAATLISEANSTAHVFKRGLEELTSDAIDTVLALIKDNAIYRGSEFAELVSEFKKLKDQYCKLNSDVSKSIFIWENMNNFASRFRNTVIGTLVQDISEGTDLENAVRMYESKVAPDNYKRTKSLITPMMIKDAMKTIENLGIDKSLERRFAEFSDISVNNVLFVNSDTKPQMQNSGGIMDLLMAETKTTTKTPDRAIQISIDDFLTNIVPKSSSLSAMIKNSMVGNFVSLTAPVHTDAPNLFKWDNGFGWSYNGNITDSIKEKVKRAGGNVDAQLRVSLNWFNKDDLDISVTEPNGNIISFYNKSGKLDVDMNVTNPVRDAVENVRWLNTPADGVYKVKVTNYTKRESIDVGFDLQVESNGTIYDFSYDVPVNGTTNAIDITVKHGIVVFVHTHKNVKSTSSSKNVWNIDTEQFVEVNTIVASPNHWDNNRAGNKHWFFILKDCINPEETRGFYNEFLQSDLDKHRKVFEILGDKMKCKNSTNQMSGIGFSSTKKDTVLIHAKGKTLNQVYEIKF